MIFNGTIDQAVKSFEDLGFEVSLRNDGEIDDNLEGVEVKKKINFFLFCKINFNLGY